MLEGMFFQFSERAEIGCVEKDRRDVSVPNLFFSKVERWKFLNTFITELIFVS